MGIAPQYSAARSTTDRPVRLRRILQALAAGDVDLEEPVEPPRRHFNERIFHALLKSFLSVEHDFDDNALGRLYQFTHDIDVLLRLARDGQLTWDPMLARAVHAFRASPAPI